VVGLYKYNAVKRSAEMYRLTLKKFLYAYLFVSIILIGCITLFLNISVINREIWVIITFIVNGMIIFFELSKNSRLGYSLRDILFLFMFIFMFISPLIQYFENLFPWWSTYLITDEKIIFANLLITVFILTYIITYKISFNERTNNNQLKNREIINIKLVMGIFFIASILCSVYIIVNTGFGNLFARATNSLKIESSSFKLTVSNTFRAVPVIYVAMNLLFMQKNGYVYKKFRFLLTSILMIVVNFPTGTARFWMATVYLGLFLVLKRKFKNPYFFKILVIIGILSVFPVIGVFRNNTFEEVIIHGINISKPSELFLAGDFDSYSMLVRTIIYVNLHGITWGNQILGNLLFFVPRKIWSTKPIGSGATIATDLGWNFTNVSCPYIAEGYINFGILGVVLFAIILAVLTKFGDVTYAKVVDKGNNKGIAIIELVYPFSVGFLFFILRGDLLSSLAYYIGFMVPVILLWLVQLLVFSRKNL